MYRSSNFFSYNFLLHSSTYPFFPTCECRDKIWFVRSSTQKLFRHHQYIMCYCNKINEEVSKKIAIIFLFLSLVKIIMYLICSYLNYSSNSIHICRRHVKSKYFPNEYFLLILVFKHLSATFNINDLIFIIA